MTKSGIRRTGSGYKAWQRGSTLDGEPRTGWAERGVKAEAAARENVNATYRRFMSDFGQGTPFGKQID
jgi:hypothetical protein